MLKDGVPLYGIFAINLFQCEKLLLPNTKIRLKLIQARPNFYMISYNPHVSLKFLYCLLFTRRVFVKEVSHQTLKYQLTNQRACYNFMEAIARTIIFPSGQNQFIQENGFNNAPIRRLAKAMNTNSAFTGHFQDNSFHYRKFGLRELRFVPGGRAVVSTDTTNNCRAYITTRKAMNFNEKIPALPNDFFYRSLCAYIRSHRTVRCW